MAAFTTIKRNLVSPSATGEPWIEQGYSSDITTAAVIKAGVAGVRHYIVSMHIHHIPGTTPKTWNLQDDNGKLITPQLNMSTYDSKHEHRFIVPLPCETGQGIWALAENSGDFGYILEGFSRVEDPFKQTVVVQASTSTSASPSASTSVSTSISASPSVSVSASPSISASPSVSVSASASVSVSTSVSASPSTSLSTSPSWSG